MSGLVKYDAARYALQQAVEIDEVKDIRDKAEAMAAYARQAKDTDMIQWVTEIKVRAERKAGQMLIEAKESGDLASQGGDRKSKSHDVTLKLEDIDISKNESSRWQKLAAIDDDKFEKAVLAAKEVAGEVTTAAMLRVERQANGAKNTNPDIGVVSAKTKKEHPTSQPEQSAAAPIDESGYSEADQLRDVIADLQEERARLIASIEVGDGVGELQREIESLRIRVSDLEADNARLALELHNMTVARDIQMDKASKLQSQVNYMRRQQK